MRDSFHEDLDRLTDDLVEMTRLAGSAMSRATTALLDADVHQADTVIEADHVLDARRKELDDLAVDLLARQQPVATDLRIVVTAMQMAANLERMGDLARHVAKIARLRHPESAVPAELRGHLLEMANVAESLVTQCGSIIAAKDVEAAAALEGQDDRMDDLHRELFTAVKDAPNLGNQTVVDLTLLGRYYERFGDHAVSVARKVIYLVTGEVDPRGDHEDIEDLEELKSVENPTA